MSTISGLNKAIGRASAASPLFSDPELVFGIGPSPCRVMIIGEAPGRNETRTGEPFVGRAGKFLMEVLKDGLGMERESVYITNVVKVWPFIETKRLKTRPPTREEEAFFVPWLAEEIRIVDPGAIVAVGKTAFTALVPGADFIPGAWQSGPGGVPVMPVYHPSYLLRKQKSLVENTEKMKAALRLVKGAVTGGKGGRGPRGGKRVEEVRERLRGLADEKRAAHLRRFFKTGAGEYADGDKFLGIRVPVQRMVAREYADLSIKEAFALLASGVHEERLVALLILIRIYGRASEQEKKDIYQGYLVNTRFINNWDLIDLSAKHILGDYLRERSRAPLYKLARSKSIWERRMSVLATFKYISRGEFAESLKIAAMLVADSEDLIHKAVGWMLREVGKRDLALEESFLKKHCTVMPRTMLRYAIEKFPEKKRQSYLKGRP